jgi:nucleotide-binding universal stress UspA family protein
LTSPASLPLTSLPLLFPQISEKVLDYCLTHFYKDGDEIHLMHVIPVPAPEVLTGLAMDSIFTIEPDPAVDVKHIADAKDFMRNRFATTLASKGVPYKVEIVHFMTDNDSIGEAICKRADALNASAVFLAKHNRGTISEWFLGSVTKYCTTHCKAPMVILHE